MIKNKCKRCGKIFEVYPSQRKKYCSRECFSKKFQVKCIICGKIREFSFIKSKKRKCCSRKCANKLNSIRMMGENHPRYRERVKLKCIICGDNFEVIQSQKNQKCCSRKCSSKLQGENRKKEKIKLECVICGKTFKVNLAVSKYKKYCSRKCVEIFQSINRKGKSYEEMYGKEKTKEIKMKQRISAINYINNHSKGIQPHLGRNEKDFLDEVELSNNIKLVRQYEVLGYFVDGYCEELNIVVEIDERPKTHERDIERENNIIKELNCKFLRIRDDF